MQENNGFDTPPTPSSEQQVALLMQSLLEKEAALAQRDVELATRDAELATQATEITQCDVELAKQQDIIRQLETKLDQSQREYLKLWEERFRARSERYIADPDQLRIDFGNTDEAADAAEGLAEAVEEAAAHGGHDGHLVRHAIQHGNQLRLQQCVALRLGEVPDVEGRLRHQRLGRRMKWQVYPPGLSSRYRWW